MSCPLCAEDHKTPWLHADRICWVAPCATCGVPMAVLRAHREPTELELVHCLDVLEHHARRFFGDDPFYIDHKRRALPAHPHWHARPGVRQAAA